MKALLKNYRQAPRKIRFVADSVRGKIVSDALAALSFAPQKAALPLKKLIESAVANAHQADGRIDANHLYIANISVDKGSTLFRYMPKAFGRANTFRRQSSHVKLELGLREGISFPEKTKKKSIKKVVKKEPK